jgi:putative transposase
LYFSGLSLRRTSERLSYFFKRNSISIWNWIQKYKPQRISHSRRKITEHIVDEAPINVGAEYIWLWVAKEPKDRKFSQ